MQKQLVIGLALSFWACATGETLGENSPGADTYLQFGDIGVDERTETSYVLTQNADAGTAELVAVPLGATSSTPVEDLTGRTNLRVLFPSTGVLVMSQNVGHSGDATLGDQQHLDLFDQTSLTPIMSAIAPGIYNGTRMSPSRNWVAVADNSQPTAPINILDMNTLSATVVPHGGDWLEAMWLNNSDTLVAIVFYNEQGPSPFARILTWEMTAVQDAGFQADSSGYWPDPGLDISVEGATPEVQFAYSWVGISPDDSQVVLPVQMPSTDCSTDVDGGSAAAAGSSATCTVNTLIVLDLTSGTTRQVPNAAGPVGFTPDGKTIVSYTANALELINAGTLAVSPETVPIKGGLVYFTSHEGNRIVVGSSFASTQLVLFDIDNDTMTTMYAPGVELDELVEREGSNQLWLVDEGELWMLDMTTAAIQREPVLFRPTAINILPNADQLVLDSLGASRLFFYDPNTLETVSAVPLPNPVE
jgi:hypothetical protein